MGIKSSLQPVMSTEFSCSCNRWFSCFKICTSRSLVSRECKNETRINRKSKCMATNKARVVPAVRRSNAGSAQLAPLAAPQYQPTRPPIQECKPENRLACLSLVCNVFLYVSNALPMTRTEAGNYLWVRCFNDRT